MVFPVLSSNSPNPGYITWTAFNVHYGKFDYIVAAGTTNKRFAYFDYSVSTPATTYNALGDPTNGVGVLVFADVLPGQDGLGQTVWDPNDNLVFLNRNGIGLYADKTSVIDGSLLVTGSILTDAIGANQINVGHMQANSVDTAQLNTNAITSTKIASGQINANHISSKVITADKLSIGSFTDNLLPNPNFEDWNATNTAPLAWTQLVSQTGGLYAGTLTKESTSITGTASVGLVAASASNRGAIFQSDAVPVTAGRDIYLGAWYAGTAVGLQVQAAGLLILFYDAAGALLASQTTLADITGSGVVEQIQHVDTAPVGSKYMQAVIFTTSTTKVVFDNTEMGYRLSGVQIQDNTITAGKIKADEVWTGTVPINKLTSGNNTTIDIGATTLQTTGAAGGSVQMNQGGITLYDANGTPVIILPTNISDANPASFAGAVTATSFSSGNTTSISGTGRFEQKSVTSLGWTTQPPSVAPTYVIDYPMTQSTGQSTDANQWYIIGLSWDATNTRWVQIQWSPKAVGSGTGLIKAVAYSSTWVYQSILCQVPQGNGSPMGGATWFKGKMYFVTSPANYQIASLYSVASGVFTGPTNVMNFTTVHGATGLYHQYPVGIGTDTTGTTLLVPIYSGNTSGSPASPVTCSVYNITDVAATGPNISPNPGFETNTTGWSSPNSTVLTRITTQFKTGVASLQLTRTTAGTSYQFTYGTSAAGIPILANTRYDWSISLKASSAVGRTLTYTINYYNSAGVLVGNESGGGFALADNSSTWTTYSGTMGSSGTPTDATVAVFLFTLTGPSGTEAHYVDDFNVTSSPGVNVTSRDLLGQATGVSVANLGQPSGITKGTIDGAASRIAIGGKWSASGATAPVHMYLTSLGTYNTNDDFPQASTGAFTHDGTQFYQAEYAPAIGTLPKVYQYTNNIWTVEGSKWWIGNTWQDTTAGFLYETALGTLRSFTMSKRARLTITSGDVPLGTAGSADPKTAGHFVGRSTTTPGYNIMFYQGNTTPVSPSAKSTIVLPSVTFTGVADPVTGLLTAPNPANNTKAFPAATPAVLQSSDATPLIKLNGDGSGRMGPYAWNASGVDLNDTGWLELAAATGYTKTTCQYRQVGKLVMIRYSFTNTAVINVAANGNITGDPAMSAALPAAFWPTAVHNYHGLNVNARLGLAFVGWTDGIIHLSATDGTGTASTVPASSTIQGNTSWLLN